MRDRAIYNNMYMVIEREMITAKLKNE